MRASLFVYNAKNIDPNLKPRINEKLFDAFKKSNYGSYEYKTKGILKKGEYIRPVRAVIIVKEKYTKTITDLFMNFGIKYRLFEILINPAEFEKSSFL